VPFQLDLELSITEMLDLVKEEQLIGIATEELNKQIEMIIQKLENSRSVVNFENWKQLFGILKETESRGKYSRRSLLENKNVQFRAITMKGSIISESLKIRGLVERPTPLLIALFNFEEKLEFLKEFELKHFNIFTNIKDAFFSLYDFLNACDGKMILKIFRDDIFMKKINFLMFCSMLEEGIKKNEVLEIKEILKRDKNYGQTWVDFKKPQHFQMAQILEKVYRLDLLIPNFRIFYKKNSVNRYTKRQKDW
jgi:hypothetical protein